ncbi:helicase, putative, RecD/TraA family [Proteiniphilum saccharofermentans]|uniref:Helicase, putative, RecD/TraA family n=2 Tax=Proteiniphilum saccharofermentans TaxID=1642647 RepID=A0A1R3SUR3_9BACT|nr:helicase, putative, RecD/TraA family [Proteiniphilum saccharofermentans]SFS29744.1 exodeoxyribonuclease-5 [Porphyromonadaceae bacterium NLAE-zl-C104]
MIIVLLLREKIPKKMVNRFFIEKISENFPFNFTDDQMKALEKIAGFLFSRIDDHIFLLTGYAGTGKSSLIGSLVKTMTEFRQKTVLLAPTGRAAKVFSGYAAQQAFTIHKKIYRQQKFAEGSPHFSLSENLHKHTLFIVDEASMISNESPDFSIFGTGRLLDDLIEYVYSAQGCRILFVGDSAQLPPVKQENSPALDRDMLRSYSLEVTEATLTQIVRQEEESGILYNATILRNALRFQMTEEYPKLKLEGFADVVRITGTELIDEISHAYQKEGMEETIVISRSNKRVNAYNSGIRNRVLYREEEISAGDILMITKNNYFWVENFEDLDFLANGEFVEVQRVRGEEEMYGFRFCNVLLYHRDYEIEFEAKIILDVLHTEVPGLTREQNDQLFFNVMEDYVDISRKRERFKKVKSNPWFNALQVKYGYAVTCHKAQGGEWKNVFLDLGYIQQSYMGESFYRWLYTSITRSSRKLFLVNLPDDFVELSK